MTDININVNLNLETLGLSFAAKNNTTSNRQDSIESKSAQKQTRKELTKRATSKASPSLTTLSSSSSKTKTPLINTAPYRPNLGRKDKNKDVVVRDLRRNGSIEFLFAPAGPIDPSLKGTYGVQYAAPGHGGIRGLSRGYTNALWGFPFSFVSGPNPWPAPLYGLGGLYTKQVTFFGEDYLGNPIRNDFGVLEMTHLVAVGNDLRFVAGAGSDAPFDEYLPDGSQIQGVKSATAACTFEFIIKVGAAVPTLTSGSTFAALSLFGDTGIGNWSRPGPRALLGVTLELNGEAKTGRRSRLAVRAAATVTESETVFLPASFGGRFVHVAAVVIDRTVSLFVDGVMRTQFTEAADNSMITKAKSMLVGCFIQDGAQDSVSYTEYPGGTSVTYTPELYNGPSVLKAIRYTDRALYTGISFSPPSEILSFA